MMRGLATVLALMSTGCATMAGTYAVTSAVYLFLPVGRAQGGEGATSEAARARIEAAETEARTTVVVDAIAAARAHPDDERLLRRAAAMARVLGDANVAGLDEVFALLERRHPCPGLADIAATRETFGDHDGAGDMYLRAARECSSTEAAIASVGPLRTVDRCDEAVAALRDAWPRVDANRRGARLAVLDAITACSEALTIRQNMSFVPVDVLEDYLSVLEDREQRALESQRQAAADAGAREAEARAEARARESQSYCQSECRAARSSCIASCAGSHNCMQRCESVGHSCSAGCGGY